MYHDIKKINGVYCERFSPMGTWVEACAGTLTTMFVNSQNEVIELGKENIELQKLNAQFKGTIRLLGETIGSMGKAARDALNEKN